MNKELKMVFESTNPEAKSKSDLKLADIDETLTGAQVLAEMQSWPVLLLWSALMESHVLVQLKKASL